MLFRSINTEARVPEQRRSVIDEHIRATSVEKRNKRKFNEEKEAVQNLSHSPQIKSSSSQLLGQKKDLDINSNCSLSTKRKRAKMYHTLPVSYAQLLPILVQKYKIPIIPAKLKSLYILNGMISMPDVNTMAGFKDILQKAAHHSKTKFKL